MSQTLDYFFNDSGGLSEVGARVGEALGCVLRSEAGSDLLCGRLLGLDLHVGTHTFDDDFGIAFSRHRFMLGSKTVLPDADLRPLQALVMSAVPWLLFRQLGIAGILVFDLQRLIGAYERRVDADGRPRLHDALTGRSTSLGESWCSLGERLPAAAWTSANEERIEAFLEAERRAASESSL